ncbi:MAG TPA: alpha/beta hydrolase-fold protein [Mycobacteriales bacterium]|nr:alpha/beta hydrolase-fold protein [Mycobacteriales bacterium]
MPRLLAAVAALAAIAAGVAPVPGQAAGPYDGCDGPGSSARVGVVACRTLPSRALGATTAFAYYVPPACADERCPTLYLLHGFGGDLHSMLGTAEHPSGWVAALSSRPRVSPAGSSSPWTLSDPATWVTAPQLPMVLVAPDGRTVADGDGPGSGLEGFWTDWNPRYAKGGDSQRYDTPAPGFATQVTDELVPYVEANFPVGSGREWRAVAGTSLGGYGSYAIGLAHPDEFASIGAVSGIMNILLLPGLDASAGGGSGGVAPPAQLPPTSLPGVAGASVPLDALPEQARGFAVATYAFGDPSVDQSYYRGRMPRDLAVNAHALHVVNGRSTQSLVVRGFSNDAVPRQPSDFADPPGYFGAQAFEAIVLVSNIEQNQAFADADVQQHYERHPGIHSDAYWNPWLRGQLEAQYAAMRHPDGSGDPPPSPTTFDYRSTASSFTVWGWRFSVRRPTSEFVDLTDVTCAGLTVRGTGVVTVAPPRRCHARDATVDLGAGMPTNAPAGIDEAPAYGHAVHVVLRTRR